MAAIYNIAPSGIRPDFNESPQLDPAFKRFAAYYAAVMASLPLGSSANDLRQTLATIQNGASTELAAAGAPEWYYSLDGIPVRLVESAAAMAGVQWMAANTSLGTRAFSLGFIGSLKELDASLYFGEVIATPGAVTTPATTTEAAVPCSTCGPAGGGGVPTTPQPLPVSSAPYRPPAVSPTGIIAGAAPPAPGAAPAGAAGTAPPTAAAAATSPLAGVFSFLMQPVHERVPIPWWLLLLALIVGYAMRKRPARGS